MLADATGVHATEAGTGPTRRQLRFCPPSRQSGIRHAEGAHSMPGSTLGAEGGGQALAPKHRRVSHTPCA